MRTNLNKKIYPNKLIKIYFNFLVNVLRWTARFLLRQMELLTVLNSALRKSCPFNSLSDLNLIPSSNGTFFIYLKFTLAPTLISETNLGRAPPPRHLLVDGGVRALENNSTVISFVNGIRLLG